MRIALVTTPPSIRSGIGDYTRRLLPHLRERAHVELFVAPGLEGEVLDGLPTRAADDLRPREFDQVLYQLGNEVPHGFMARMVRAVGGTVVQHDWVLFDMALSAFPALSRGGAKGHFLALREGGLEQARVYLANWLDRRRQRLGAGAPGGAADPSELSGTLLSGWHSPEPAGRWTADLALVRLPSRTARAVEVELLGEPGRTVRLLERGAPRAEVAVGRATREARLVAELRPGAGTELALETTGIQVSREQRQHGDTRRLGSFVRSIRYRDDGGWRELDLSVPAARTIRTIELSRDRFRLPLNHSVVRHADAFLVHSEHVKQRILRSRNAYTPVGVVPHGARPVLEVDRAAARARLGLEGPWRDAFLAVSFGAVQPHKRTDRLLRALARARSRDDRLRAAIVGPLFPEELDAVALAGELGLEEHVRFPGYVTEEESLDWLRAGDVAVNLRGPSTGGTSGGVYQAFSAGRAVVVSDADEQRELPDACTLRVAPAEGDGEREVEDLARCLNELAGDTGRRDAMEAAAREYVASECSWERVAARYVELLERFPGPRSARRGLIALRFRERLAARRRELRADGRTT